MIHQKMLGFTLIELVITIVILGILSAIALPRFLDLSTDARRALNASVTASLRTAAATYAARLTFASSTIIQGAYADGVFTSGIKAVDVDPNQTPGSVLFYKSDKVIGAKVGLSRSGSPATMSVDPAGATLGKTNSLSHNCTNLFNTLLADSTQTIVTVLGSTGSADIAAPYQSLTFTSPLPNTLIAVNSGNTSLTTALSKTDPTPNNTPNAPNCLWVQTSSIENMPVFYIHYNPTTGIFTAFEGS